MLNIVLIAQENHRLLIDERSNKPMLVGTCQREALQDSNFSGWFNSEYENYKVKKEFDNEIIEKLENTEITIVMGTWCSDSRREVPRFYKILDSLKFPDSKINLILVDRTKNGLENEVEGLNIELVPTMIFYDKNKKELGRIIETPEETLEEDLIDIID